MSTNNKIEEDNALVIGVYSKILENIIEQMADLVYLGFDGAVSTVMYTVKQTVQKRKEELEDPHLDEGTRERIKRELMVISGLFQI